jgi:hypothetical protein
MDAQDPLQRCFLAEWYQPAAVNRDIDQIAALLRETAERVQGEGHPIRLLATVAAPTDQVLYGLFVAESADIVTRVCLGTGWPADRITSDIRARIAG